MGQIAFNLTLNTAVGFYQLISVQPIGNIIELFDQQCSDQKCVSSNFSSIQATFQA